MDTVVRVYVVTGYGLNCEEETAAAWAGAGAAVEVVHAEDLFSGARPLASADIVHLSGGFSYGDNLGSGKVFAVRMRHDERGGRGTLADELQAWVARGGQLVGVCNGFQILVKAGLLPNLRGDLRIEATLAPNSPGGFVDRWVRCHRAPSPSPAFDGLDVIDLPMRHGEGRLLFADAQTAQACAGLVPLRYHSDLSGAPLNPNGSAGGAAALTDPSGRVLGLMPHPEAFLDAALHPDRQRAPGATAAPFFSNLVNAARALRARR